MFLREWQEETDMIQGPFCAQITVMLLYHNSNLLWDCITVGLCVCACTGGGCECEEE